MVGRVAVVEVVLVEVDRQTLVAGETLAEEGMEAEVEEGRLRILHKTHVSINKLFQLVYM